MQDAHVREAYADTYRGVARELAAQVESVLRDGVATGEDFVSADVGADTRLTVQLCVAMMQRHVVEGTTPSTRNRDALAAYVLRALR